MHPNVATMVTLGFLILGGVTIGNLQESKANEIKAKSVDIVSSS